MTPLRATWFRLGSRYVPASRQVLENKKYLAYARYFLFSIDHVTSY